MHLKAQGCPHFVAGYAGSVEATADLGSLFFLANV
jgi:hypothetical protein